MTDNTHEAILQAIADKINDPVNQPYVAWLEELDSRIFLTAAEIVAGETPDTEIDILIDGDEFVVTLKRSEAKQLEDDCVYIVYEPDSTNRFCLSDPRSLDQLHTHLVKFGMRNLPEFKNG